MTRSIIVALNGVYQQINTDFVAKGNKVVFKRAPSTGGTLNITSLTNNKHNIASYTCTGTQTTFNLPAFPRSKFEIIPHTDRYRIPKGYVVIDADHEIEAWIRDNCPASDWKWADPEPGTGLIAGEWGMIRMIVRDTVLTFIATKWSE